MLLKAKKQDDFPPIRIIKPAYHPQKLTAILRATTGNIPADLSYYFLRIKLRCDNTTKHIKNKTTATNARKITRHTKAEGAGITQ